jgi:hypothetical protein
LAQPPPFAKSWYVHECDKLDETTMSLEAFWCDHAGLYQCLDNRGGLQWLQSLCNQYSDHVVGTTRYFGLRLHLESKYDYEC